METDAGVCPLLGLAEEQGAYLTYPSYENRCYSSRAPQPIPLNEQTFFCLGGHSERCPRFQARQALLKANEEQEAAAAAGPESAASDEWPQPGEGDEAQAAAAAATLAWSDELAAEEWQDLEPDLMPPPPGYMLPAAASGRSRRPVWPLLLAAGTLVAVLMMCGLASAGWLGWRALSTSLAVQPSGTPVVEGGGTPPPALVITGTSIPGGVVVVVATPTPNPPEATATAAAAATATATALGIFEPPTATPTEFVSFETPAFETPSFEQPTPTWTPFVFETPTPRDTPTFFPTNTPVPVATATATWTPFPVATATPVTEPFSVSFIANPLSIDYGQSSTLTWTVRGVKAIYLDGEAISGPTGSKIVRPLTTTTYVLRIILLDNSVREETQTVTVSVPTPSATPTPTATPTATPFINMVFAQDLSITSISGQDASCRTGSGCTLFQVQVRNVGNRPAEYQLTKSETIPVGWGVFFCWATDCEFGNTPPAKTLAPGARDTISINYRVPSVLIDGDVATVNVTGTCPACAIPPFQTYSNTFRVLVILPTPTPTWTPTATPTSPARG